MEPEAVAHDGIWDYVCVGEGELALLELVNCLERRLCPKSIPNMFVLSNGELIKNKMGKITDLNDIPNHHDELFDLKSFLSSQNGWMRLMISRGCPNRCSYCLSNKIISRYFAEGVVKCKKELLRCHPIPKVIDEISYLKRKFPEDKNT